MQLSKSEQKRLATKYGNWAMVTGASSGIGKEIAYLLAQASFNLVITARREAILNEMADELSSKYGITVKTEVGDLSQQEDVERLLENTKNLPIGLLVANAGFGTSGKFLDSDLSEELNMLDLNCKSVLMMTHRFAQKFATAKRGGIILMSSMVGFQGVPNAAHYAATKAYIQSLGEALAVELKGKGIDVLAAAPGPVATGFAERAKMDMGNAQSPAKIALDILKAIGRKSTVLPGTLTKVLVYSLRTAPRWGKIRIMQQVMGGMTKHQTL